MEDINNIIEISEKISEIFENKLNGEEYNADEILELIKDNNISEEDEDINSSEANEELLISPHMYNQTNNKSFISYDKKNENVVFCGKYYMKKRYLLVIFFLSVIFVILIWLYYNYHNINKK